jgi:hypothetical protein
MDTRALARAIGVFVLALGALGLFMGDTQVANALNTDLMLDLTRIVLGVILIAASFMDEKAIRAAFAIFGIVYLGNFAAALISPDMFGMLPHLYGWADNALHLVGGLLGLWIGFMPAERRGVRHAA